jgi:hypothetical protein
MYAKHFRGTTRTISSIYRIAASKFVMRNGVSIMPPEALGFLAGFSEAQDQGRPFDEMFAELTGNGRY